MGKRTSTSAPAGSKPAGAAVQHASTAGNDLPLRRRAASSGNEEGEDDGTEIEVSPRGGQSEGGSNALLHAMSTRRDSRQDGQSKSSGMVMRPLSRAGKVNAVVGTVPLHIRLTQHMSAVSSVSVSVSSACPSDPAY